MYRILVTTLLLFLTGCQEGVPSQLSQKNKGMVVQEITDQAQIKKRVALVIGNANYELAPLKNPVNDAKDMAKALRSIGFHVIDLFNASEEEMDTSIDEFEALLGKGVVGLFYFSGHGIQLENQNYLLPIDLGKPSVRKVQRRSISATSVLKVMEAADNSMNILVLDACRDNPFKGFKGLSKSIKRGLARMGQVPTGTLIAYATSPGDTAADGYGRNSPYTAGLLAYIHQPNLPIELMFKRVRNVVKKKTHNRQTPWESSSLEGEDFYFVVSARSDTPPVVPIPSNTGAEDAEIARLKREKAEAENKARQAQAELERQARLEAENRAKKQAEIARLKREKSEAENKARQAQAEWERQARLEAEKQDKIRAKRYKYEADASNNWYVIAGSHPQNSQGKRDARESLELLQQAGFEEFLVADSDEYNNLTNGLWVVMAGPYRKSDANWLKNKLKRTGKVRGAYIKRGW